MSVSLQIFGCALATVSCVTSANLGHVLDQYSHPRHGWHRADGESLPNPVPTSEESVQAGKVLFHRFCAGCHGELGRGDGPAASRMSRTPADLAQLAPDRTDYHIYLQVSLGRDEMPMWEAELTDEDRWHLVNFIRSLAADD